jgi:hypothetical protein
LYKRLLGETPPDDMFQVRWAWYLKYLDARIIEMWSGTLRQVIIDLAPQHCLAGPVQMARVYEVLVVIAEAIKQRSEFSIDNICDDLRATDLINDGASLNDIRQMVWILAEHLTQLYDPEAVSFVDDADNVKLRLRRMPTLMRARTRARVTVLTSFSGKMHLAEDQFHEALDRFGDLLPKPYLPSFTDQPQLLSFVEYLNVAYLCVDGLKKVAKIRIEWVNTLELHLQPDQRKRILRLFRFPTFCQLLYEEKGERFLHRCVHLALQTRGPNFAKTSQAVC